MRDYKPKSDTANYVDSAPDRTQAFRDLLEGPTPPSSMPVSSSDEENEIVLPKRSRHKNYSQTRGSVANVDTVKSDMALAGAGPRRQHFTVSLGIADLPNQVYRRIVKDGFEFNLMVCGASGLGKSTMINSLFLTDVYSADYPGPSLRIKKTLKVEKTHVRLEENGVELRLTVVDTPGFGDSVNNDKCWEPIQNFIDSQFDQYLNQESRVNRPVRIQDTRTHVCLYFIQPTGHGLKPIDIEFMRRLHDKVNIIPLIAKADTLTPEEREDFKHEIMREIEMHKINIYEFPDFDDEEENRVNKKIKDQVPFAVIGSNCVLQIGDKRIRARQYPWGIAEVENKSHCDFRILRDMLIRTHMQDLIDVTSVVHYENFRARKLSNVMSSKLTGKSPMAQIDEERREHKLKMKKMEREMESVFETKVKEKQNRLVDSEKELKRKHENSKLRYEQDQAELEQRRREFEAEKAEWEKRLESDKPPLNRFKPASTVTDYRPLLKPRDSSMSQ